MEIIKQNCKSKFCTYCPQLYNSNFRIKIIQISKGGHYCRRIYTEGTGQKILINKLFELSNFKLANLDCTIEFIFAFQLEKDPVRLDRQSLYWAMCIPASCSPRDLQISLNRTLTPRFNEQDINLNITVDPIYCHTSERKPFTRGFYITM